MGHPSAHSYHFHTRARPVTRSCLVSCAQAPDAAAGILCPFPPSFDCQLSKRATAGIQRAGETSRYSTNTDGCPLLGLCILNGFIQCGIAALSIRWLNLISCFYSCGLVGSPRAARNSEDIHETLPYSPPYLLFFIQRSISNWLQARCSSRALVASSLRRWSSCSLRRSSTRSAAALAESTERREFVEDAEASLSSSCVLSCGRF